MVRAFSFAVALVIATASASDEYFEGDGTSYTLSQVSSGNCNFMSAIPSASTNYVAMNQPQWDSLGSCGRCVEVSCIDEQCTAKNKTAVVQVLDRCPECAQGALDLSPTVYKEITGLDPNRLTIRWKFVDCPGPGTVQVCLKEGSNSNWIAVQPTNGLVGVESVTVNGAKTTMLDGAYYYVSTASGADLSAVKVGITSVNGDEISGSYALTAGKCTDTKKQFGSGSSSTEQKTSAPKATKATTVAPKATTAAPKATTAAPKATTATPSTPTQTDSSAKGSYDQDDNTQEDQNSQSDETQNEASSGVITAPIATTATPEATTATPEATTATPESTTATPESTTASPESTTATPESTTASPESTTATPESTTATPESTTATPESTTATPETTPATPEATDAPTQSGDTSKCRVRSSRRHRN